MNTTTIIVKDKEYLCEEGYGVEYDGKGFPFEPYSYEKIIGDKAYLVDAKGIVWIYDIDGSKKFTRSCLRESVVYIYMNDPDFSDTLPEEMFAIIGVNDPRDYTSVKEWNDKRLKEEENEA
jgi:hypothetical protein